MSKKTKGFTLLEMMLVLVIISFIIYAAVGYIQQRTEAMRVERASTQLQQILNAGLSYYVANNKWPASLDKLKGSYIPNIPLTNPWGQTYNIAVYSPPPTSPGQTQPPDMFYVYTSVVTASPGLATSTALTISGTLPLAYTSAGAGTPTTPPPQTTACGDSTTVCNVVTSVNIPGQNLNNARAVNFAGLYHHGACVPVPECPVASAGGTKTPMVPEIMVTPVQVSGTYDNKNQVYPISSFTAYATSSAANPVRPPLCQAGFHFGALTCTQNNVGPPAKAYWRVCLQVITQRGMPTYSYGEEVTLMAITRCSIPGEPSGSNFDVYGDR